MRTIIITILCMALFACATTNTTSGTKTGKISKVTTLIDNSEGRYNSDLLGDVANSAGSAAPGNFGGALGVMVGGFLKGAKEGWGGKKVKKIINKYKYQIKLDNGGLVNITQHNSAPLSKGDKVEIIYSDKTPELRKLN